MRESALDAEDEAPLRGLVLLDLPDVDSVAAGNRVEADRLVGIVDLVIWVLDPQKYADQTVHEEYLRQHGRAARRDVVVFNQVDRLTPADAARCRADLARLVEADGLPGVPVISTSAVTGEGVDEIRALLEKTVAGRPAGDGPARGRTRRGGGHGGAAGRRGPGRRGAVSREAVPELADGFAAATGSARSPPRRPSPTGPGRPCRAGRSGRHEAAAVDVPPADPAAVGAGRPAAGRPYVGRPARAVAGRGARGGQCPR